MQWGKISYLRLGKFWANLIFDTLGGKKVIYEEKNPSAPPVIDH